MTCARNLRRYVPEFVEMWERVTDLAGGGDHPARMLSMYCPTPYLSGCSQAVWTGGDPILVRNYDYHPELCEGWILASNWHGTRVIATSDSLWGALDGMNEHGLEAALAFGGSPSVGTGFGIPLLIRYVLEFCKTTVEAVEALSRIPSHMSYNVLLLDRSGDFRTVFLNPGGKARAIERPWVTNHQEEASWSEYEALTRSRVRGELLDRSISGKPTSAPKLISRFLRPPLFATDYERAFGTLYTVVFRPAEGKVRYVWKNHEWHQSFGRFVEGTTVIRYD
jgi:predicted choloylglycine hydrolase